MARHNNGAEMSQIKITCQNCNEEIMSNKLLIDVCPSCMKPWRQDLLKTTPEENISKFVLEAFQRAKKDALWKNSGTRLKTYHVSDFVSPCLRKSHYSKIPELKKEMDAEMVSILYQGIIVHDNSQLSAINELTMCYDIVNRISVDIQDVKNMDEKQKENILTGTLDDLLRVGRDFVICDKKTYNSRGYAKKEASPEHMKQVNIYKVMLDAAYGINAEFGCNLYLDKGNGYKELPIVYRTAPIEETQEFLESTLKKFKAGLPDPTITFLCNMKNRDKKCYCNYIDQCTKDGRDNFV